MTANKLSIIIPTLNEATTLPLILGDLIGAGLTPEQIIVCDGGSEDNTLAIARGFNVHIMTVPSGRARQLQEAANNNSAEVLWFVHSDTRICGDAVAEVFKFVDGAYPNQWGRFDISLSGPQKWCRLIETFINWRSRLTGIATGDQGIFLRAAALEKIGGIPQQPLMEDVELTYRLKRLSKPYCSKVRVVTSSRRWERGGVIKTILLMWGFRFLYFVGVNPKTLRNWYANVR